MAFSDGQYHSFQLISDTHCSPICTVVDTWCALCCSEAKATVSFIFYAPRESWVRNGECIGERKTSVFTVLLSAHMLLIAVSSYDSSELLIQLLSYFFLVPVRSWLNELSPHAQEFFSNSLKQYFTCWPTRMFCTVIHAFLMVLCPCQ